MLQQQRRPRLKKALRKNTDSFFLLQEQQQLAGGLQQIEKLANLIMAVLFLLACRETVRICTRVIGGTRL